MSSGRSSRPERVGEILDLAMERPAVEREAFIATLCGGDEGLRIEAESLLRALDRVGDLLEPEGALEEPALAGVDPSAASVAALDLEGTTVGPYSIGPRIGAGGMGVVYRGEDTRLGRTVAIKSLPPELGQHPERCAMLEHEARMLAALAHPNIGAIYGLERGPHGPLLVLEHVGGRTLGELLAGGAMPIDDARAVARQILLALEAAHAAGVVHRDIKPSNVKLTPEGVVKVLDFGIAKLGAGVGPAASDSSVLRRTEPGRLIGTPAYMSPEQARGRTVDRRTDVWAFGCLLYEMLTGAAVFRGETGTDTVAAVLRAEPDWSRLPPGTSISERRLLRKCLEKDPDRRLRDAGDARLELEDAPTEALSQVSIQKGIHPALLAGILAAGALLGAGAVYGLLPRHPLAGVADAPRAESTHMSIDFVPAAGPAADSMGGCIAVSPDGRTIAYVAGATPPGTRLFVRQVDAFDAVELPGTVGATSPCFSPDGKWLAYGAWGESGEIRKVRTSGGTPVRVCSGARGDRGLCWAADDTIVFSDASEHSLARVPAAGGRAVPITTVNRSPPDTWHLQPEVLADGSAVLFSCMRFEGGEYKLSVELVSLANGARKRLLDDASQPRVLPGGRLLYYQDGAVKAVGFDAERRTTLGEPRTVLSPIAGTEEMLPRSRFSVSAGGTLAYLPSTTNYDSKNLIWVALDGSTQLEYKMNGLIDSLRISPDGRRVAIAAGTVRCDVWSRDLARGTMTILTAGGSEFYPVWTRDGKRIAFKSESKGEIQWVAADGTSEPERLISVPRGSHCYPNTFTSDGQTLIFTMAAPDEPEDLYSVSVTGDATPKRLFETPSHADRFGARLDPTGTLISYTSEESGRQEVYVRPFPALDRMLTASSTGGFRSAWSADGKTLYYRFEDRLYAVAISASPDLSAAPPQLLLEHLPEARYDPAPDGRRFLTSEAGGGSAPQTRINVILNWVRDIGRSDLPTGN